MDNATFKKLIEERILVIDGATGTELAKLGLGAQDFGGERYEGCCENLCLTKPSAITTVHESYLAAGADIVETCTFGATRVVMAEYGLEDKVREINIAAAKLARRAAVKFSTTQKPRFVAGSIGPGTKTIFVTKSINFAEMRAAYLEQTLALAEGGADFFLIETAQDILNVRAAAEASFEAAKKAGREIPVFISVTFGAGGKMLSGQDAAAVYVALAHYPLAALGFNCSAGPEEMADNLRLLASRSQFPVFCMPNAGLPDENGAYTLAPEKFAAIMADYANDGILNIAGGCCGTSPAHIKELARALDGKKPRSTVPAQMFCASGMEAVFEDEVEAPFLVGERANVIGSREFRNFVTTGNWPAAADVMRRQTKNGAHILDICLANPERDEITDLQTFVPLAARAVRLPLMIDTTNPKAAETALAMIPGKAVWNSINLEAGPQRLLEGAALNRKYGCALVVGCIDESGKDSMAVTRERKLEIAKRAHDILSSAGVPDEDMIFDALVFPAAAGQDKYLGAALETVKALELFKTAFPRSKSVLGVSNVSFGLPQAGREVLNSIFLYHAVKAGLGMAIVNVEKLRRYPSLSDAERALGEELLFAPKADTATRFAELYRDKTARQNRPVPATPEEKLRRAVLEGTQDGVREAALELAEKMPAMDVINGPLAAGMAEVGQLFSRGELIVTEVLQSAETMKLAVSALEPHLKKQKPAPRGKLLLATVRGDVHDIGKNLVHMIFESNGFEVVDLGVKVPNQTIVDAARKERPDIIGLSGLLTKSAEAMITVCADLGAAGIKIPVIAGGAALSEKFVQTKLAPACAGPVHYAKDAMSGLATALQITGSR